MRFETINSLPRMVEQDDADGGVLRPWVRRLPLRFQGVLTTALRGCDTAAKEDHSKRLVAMVRRAILNPADPRESLTGGGFFGFDPDKLKIALGEFLHSLDAYPLHYIMHLCHACEVIAYHHPEMAYRNFFFSVYCSFCKKMHLNPERADQLLTRLTEDRVAKGTVERDF